ncbi:MAG: hypothetical protein M1482_02325 [Chloroflexi bacterium]|nr:hypothetical protein [Chloroflexota bacterium]
MPQPVTQETLSSRSRGMVEVFIDPKTPELDRTIRDIMAVSKEATDLMPASEVESIEVRENFAVVTVKPAKRGGREVAIKLYRSDGHWVVKACDFKSRKRRQGPSAVSHQSSAR